MIGFRAFLEETAGLEESIVRKGAVALYALQSKRHGDEAVRHYQAVRQALALISKKAPDQKVDILAQAMTSLADGLTATRQQIGSVSAQLTASSL
jgi:ribosomal protein S7